MAADDGDGLKIAAPLAPAEKVPLPGELEGGSVPHCVQPPQHAPAELPLVADRLAQHAQPQAQAQQSRGGGGGGDVSFDSGRNGARASTFTTELSIRPSTSFLQPGRPGSILQGLPSNGVHGHGLSHPQVVAAPEIPTAATNPVSNARYSCQANDKSIAKILVERREHRQHTTSDVRGRLSTVFHKLMTGHRASEMAAVQSSLSFSQTLTLTLSCELLRGVPLQEALAGMGKHWASSPVTGVACEEEFELSQPTLRLNDFISHDWGTPRVPKFLSLCVVYNSATAVWISVLVSLILGISQTDYVGLLPVGPRLRVAAVSSDGALLEDLYHGIWCMCICPIIFAVVFACWHWIRYMIRLQAKLIFLDRLCIHQTDMERKIKGIYGLAAFLAQSDRLLVLWTPRYFTRLWCAYELAAWCYLKGPNQRLRIFPVATPSCMASAAAFSYTTEMVLHFTPVGVAGNVLRICSSVVMCFAYVKLTRRSNRELAILQQRLSSFRVEETLCFCCENEHEDPKTGKTIVCDRELVYSQLKKWFHMSDNFSDVLSFRSATGEMSQMSSDGTLSDPHEHLRGFNRKIQTEIRDRLPANAGLSYTNALCVSVPFLWRLGDICFRTYELDRDATYHIVFRYLMHFFVAFPCWVRATAVLLSRLDRGISFCRLSSLHCPGDTICFELTLALMLCALDILMRLPLLLACELRSWPLQIAVASVLALVVAVMYRQGIQETARQTSTTRISVESELQPAEAAMSDPFTVNTMPPGGQPRAYKFSIAVVPSSSPRNHS
eukprot:TRINITY_DN24507_c0_g1_i1.p1 TRINITY_DN24507_c0_g1~~TRINITY_DN24507_c0_g1_i1.p1  ORF type:complete len:780 (-),score=79.06 TRINITY_DN24507_c0_g1_i1:216-2555(-)